MHVTDAFNTSTFVVVFDPKHILASEEVEVALKCVPCAKEPPDAEPLKEQLYFVPSIPFRL